MGNLADSILIGLLFAATPYSELLRLYDYDRNAPLDSRSDVDPKRLGYVGGSFGAFVGSVLSGVEKRIRTYALPSGLASITEATVGTVTKARETLPKEQLEKSFDIIDAVSAVYHVSHAAPAALLFQNGDKVLQLHFTARQKQPTAAR
jgi:hypothetical protein